MVHTLTEATAALVEGQLCRRPEREGAPQALRASAPLLSAPEEPPRRETEGASALHSRVRLRRVWVFGRRLVTREEGRIVAVVVPFRRRLRPVPLWRPHLFPDIPRDEYMRQRPHGRCCFRNHHIGQLVMLFRVLGSNGLASSDNCFEPPTCFTPPHPPASAARPLSECVYVKAWTRRPTSARCPRRPSCGGP